MYLLWFTRAYGIRAWALSAGTTKSFWGRGENGKQWEVQWIRDAPGYGVGNGDRSGGLGNP